MRAVSSVLFGWTFLRTTTQKKNSQIALRNFSAEVGRGETRGEGQYMCDFGEGGIHAIKNIIFCRSFLFIMRSSCHHEGF